MNLKKIFQIVLIVILLILTYAIAPILHPFAMFFYKNPIVIELGILTAVIIVFLSYKRRMAEIFHNIAIIILIFSVILSPLLYLTNAYSLTTLQKENLPKEMKDF